MLTEVHHKTLHGWTFISGLILGVLVTQEASLTAQKAKEKTTIAHAATYLESTQQQKRNMEAGWTKDTVVLVAKGTTVKLNSRRA